MKKNSGFSLVELIVVIAIMAVLVGVLAPAYLKYVEKSRKSTDIDAISEIMNSAEKVATDVEYERLTGAGTTFELQQTGSEFTLDATAVADTDDNASLIAAWADSANVKEDGSSYKYTLKSKEFKGIAQADRPTFTGHVANTGAVWWEVSAGSASAYFNYSASFQGKFSS